MHRATTPFKRHNHIGGHVYDIVSFVTVLLNYLVVKSIKADIIMFKNGKQLKLVKS